MIFIKKIIITIIILLLVLLIYLYYQISIFKVKKVLIENNNKSLEEEIKLIQISDYHNNNFIDKKRLIKTIRKLNPHFIVLTGDIIDSQTKDFDKTINLLRDIKKVNGNIYSVGGNHEKNNEKSEEFRQRMEDVGIYSLDNKHIVLDIGGGEINLCGLPFDKNRKEKVDIWQDLSQDLFTILLSHSPKQALENKEFKKDLILTGHIHGGQVRLPLIGAVVSPEEGTFPKYSKGLYDIENIKLYIDSGLGNSVFPLRAFNRVQISFIEIK